MLFLHQRGYIKVPEDMSLPPLNALRAFEAAARLGSFRAAADELYVTHPVISRHIRGLEDRLRVKLFEKSARGVLLTQNGQRYFKRITLAFREILEATNEASSLPHSTWLRLAVVPGLAARWLTPRLNQFKEVAPHISIGLEPTKQFDCIARGDADIGIGYGSMVDFDGEIQTLCCPTVFPVCSPGYLRGKPHLVDIQDLLATNLIHEDQGATWTNWFNSQGIHFSCQDFICYATTNQTIEVALAGQGVALVNELLVHDELNCGRLIRLVGNCDSNIGYQLILRSGAISAPARAFCHWLQTTLTAHRSIAPRTNTERIMARVNGGNAGYAVRTNPPRGALHQLRW